LNWGAKQTAKRHIKAEEKFRTGGKSEKKKSKKSKKDKNKTHDEETATSPKFKRRGPRPKKNNHKVGAVEEDELNIDNVLLKTSRTSEETKNEVDRAELFGDRKPSKQKEAKKKHENDINPVALTDEERRELASIDADEKAIDTGLDILGNQVESLLLLSKQINETTRTQNKKLDKIDNQMDKADEKSKLVNQRAKLFTMNRRQKKKENTKFEPIQELCNPSLATKAAATMAAY
jgi:hypothetical protein